MRTWEEQLARQEQLEDVGVNRGRERFLKALHTAEAKGRRSQVGGAHSLMLKALNGIEEGIVEWITAAEGKRGQRPSALSWLKTMKPDVFAYLTIKVLLDGLHQPRSLYVIATQIAQCVEDELVYRRLRQHKPALFQYLTTAKFLTQHYRHNAHMLRGAVRANVVDVADLKMSKAEKMHVGTKLIDLCITRTGLFRAELVPLHKGAQEGTARRFRKNSKRDQWQIHAEPATIQWIAKKNDLLQWLTPMALPMVVPPIPWSPLLEAAQGGYRYGLRGKYDLVRGVSPQQQVAVKEKAVMPRVYHALNMIQSTAWRINPHILAVVEQIEALGGGLAGVPMLEPEPLPAKPHDIESNREARKVWRTLAHATITANTIRTQAALKWKRTMREADILRDEETLFFPHNVDFRGRIYPIATHLTPQGDDLSKGLLTFVEGKPLGEAGYRALCIHGANCMDTDPETQARLGQQSLEVRLRWCQEHTKEILAAATNPIRHHAWWSAAEEPLQFLAFCYEYAGFTREGLSYVSALPVSIDGSCNGLQHFSAMFRDELGGSAVNLVPSDVPQDIYQRVTDTITKMCREIPDGPGGDYAIARRWLSSGLLTRKLAKRPTMTFGYGSRVYGFQDQLIEYLSTDLRPTWADTKAHFTIDGQAMVIQSCRFLSRLIWDALQQNVVKAFQGMEWLQACARQVVRGSAAGVKWMVPETGFPVCQEYYHQEKREIATILAGRVIKPRLYHATGKPLAVKQVNGMSPNVIHSLDAAALVLMVERASQEGVLAFAVVHDSFGVVAGDMATLARTTREAFVHLYGNTDVAMGLWNQFQEQLPASSPPACLPKPPLPGSLDLDAVLKSHYFFA